MTKSPSPARENRKPLTPVQTALVAFLLAAVLFAGFLYYFLAHDGVREILTLIATAYSVGIGIRRLRKKESGANNEANEQEKGQPEAW